MAKLTKAQVNEIKSAINLLGAAIADIENERTILALESLVTAMDTLQDFLKTHTTKHNYLDEIFNNPLDQIDNFMELRK